MLCRKEGLYPVTVTHGSLATPRSLRNNCLSGMIHRYQWLRTLNHGKPTDSLETGLYLSTIDNKDLWRQIEFIVG